MKTDKARYHCYEQIFFYDQVIIGLFHDRLTGSKFIASLMNPPPFFPTEYDECYFCAEISQEQSNHISRLDSRDKGWTKALNDAYRAAKKLWLWDAYTDKIEPLSVYKNDWLPAVE